MIDLNIQQTVSRISLLFPRRNVPILMYHQIVYVSRDQDSVGLCVSPEVFDKQMRSLLDRGFSSISLDELISTTNGGRKYLKKTFALTFDDGYLDNYTNALPILNKFGFTATVFLISDYVGKRKVWGIRKGTPFMTWKQAREMSRHGISFQSHTCTHPDLTKLDDKNVLRELLDSKKRIEDALGLPVRHLAYPTGNYDERIIELVKKAGYQSAYATSLSLGGRFGIERSKCNTCGLKFRIETCAWNSWLRHVRHLHKGMWHVIRRIHGANN